MKLHRNAKLGLAGRFALARAIEGGMSMKAARGRLQRLIGNRTPLVAPLARSEPGSAGEPGLSRRPLEQTAQFAQVAVGLGPAADRAGSPPHGLGPETAGPAHRLCALDSLEGASPSRSLTASATSTGAGQPL